MSDAEYNLLCDLRSIPQRNNNFYRLTGEKREVARGLVKQGLVVAEYFADDDSQGYRLNKPGRKALLAEWQRRGMPEPGETERN